MNLIFISTDGVLANQHYMDLISNRGVNYMSNLQNQIDKNKISLLNYLVNKTKGLVVFSGSWRCAMSLDKLNAMIEKAGATFKAVDMTPYLFKSEKGRDLDHVDEVDKYLLKVSRLGVSVTNFAILDDRRDFRQFNNRLIRINYDRGLKPIHVERCLDLFSIPRKKSVVG